MLSTRELTAFSLILTFEVFGEFLGPTSTILSFLKPFLISSFIYMIIPEPSRILFLTWIFGITRQVLYMMTYSGFYVAFYSNLSKSLGVNINPWNLMVFMIIWIPLVHMIQIRLAGRLIKKFRIRERIGTVW